MELHSSSFTAFNVPADFHIPESMEYFSLTAPSNTQIWREPSSQDEYTAPMVLTRLRGPFVEAEVTVSAHAELEWDQAGLVIFSGSPLEARSAQNEARRRRRPPQFYRDDTDRGKWAKVGLEYTDGMLNVASAVATTSAGADWSLSPLHFPAFSQEGSPLGGSSLRIKFERIGESLWIWWSLPLPAGFYADRTPQTVRTEWRKLREVMGFFRGAQPKTGTWVGCFAARPVLYDAIDAWERAFASREDSHGLFVEFEDLTIL